MRSVIRGTQLTETERNLYSPNQLQDLLSVSSKQDVVHLLVFGLKQNELISKEHNELEKSILKAVYRYERIRYEYEKLCVALEEARIPFMPLKGSVIRNKYPEPWMRTSCDTDIFIRKEDIKKAVDLLTNRYGYSFRNYGAHDVSLDTPNKNHLELHFSLTEENENPKAFAVLQSVWEESNLRKGFSYWYEMPMELFYFYHIVHMAKHFEAGGHGIKPFLDIWVMDRMDVDRKKCKELLERGGLSRFEKVMRELGSCWLDGRIPDGELKLIEQYIINGGVYGTMEQFIAMTHTKTQKKGKLRYVLSRVFMPYKSLCIYYPSLKKHPAFYPLYQGKRWLRILFGKGRKRAISEFGETFSLSQSDADRAFWFRNYLGLK